MPSIAVIQNVEIAGITVTMDLSKESSWNVMINRVDSHPSIKRCQSSCPDPPYKAILRMAEQQMVLTKEPPPLTMSTQRQAYSHVVS
jgi:hypothetical protein